MTLIKMTTDKMVSEDGRALRHLKEGKIYCIRENAARECFANGWGVKPTQADLEAYELAVNPTMAAVNKAAQKAPATLLDKFVDSYFKLPTATKLMHFAIICLSLSLIGEHFDNKSYDAKLAANEIQAPINSNLAWLK